MEKIDKKTRILLASEKLFAELGYEGTSTRQISKEAGANMAMINYYFGSKEGVFMEIVNNRINTFHSQLMSINGDQISNMEKLLRVVDSYAKGILANVAFHRMMQRELSLAQRPEMFTPIKDAMLANVNIIESIINDGIASGNFREVDVRMLIATIVGTISNVVVYPFKVYPDPKLDINIEHNREIITHRLIAHLHDLIKTYLTPNNDTENN